MDEATKAKLKEAGLEAVITSFEKLEADLKTATDTVAERDKTIAEKDAVIDQKNQDIVGARKEYKKLKELTDEERQNLSQKEIELHEAALDLQRRQEDFEKLQTDARQKEVDERRTNAIAKIAGKDAELAKKIEDNFKSIVGHDKAQTEAEISQFVEKAFNMTGQARPDPVREAMNGEGDAPGTGGGDNFAETSQGKELAGMLGLNQEAPAQAPGNEGAQA